MRKGIAILAAACFSATSVQAQGDIALAAIAPVDYQVPGTTAFSVAIENKGSGVSSYNLFWRLDNGSVQSVSKKAIDTEWNGKIGLVHDPAFSISLPATGTYQLAVWVKSIAPADNNPANDTLIKSIHVFENLPKKNVVLEIFKHQGCGPCYPAANFTDTFVTKNPRYAIVNIYTGKNDALFNAEGTVVDGQYGFAHPMPVFDRFQFPFRSELGTSYSSRSGQYGLDGYGEREKFFEPVQVYFKSVSYSEDTRKLTVTAGAEFFDDLNGDYRFNVFLTEDSVKGFQAAAPDANNYYHKRVLRAMLGGPWGMQGSLPATIKDGDSKDYTFEYNIPADYKLEKMRVVVLVQQYTADDHNRRILNSDHKTLEQAVSVRKVHSPKAQLSLYPNPVRDQLTISLSNTSKPGYQLRIMDVAGRTFMTLNCMGDTVVDLRSLPAGNYMLYADDGQVVHTRAIVKE